MWSIRVSKVICLICAITFLVFSVTIMRSCERKDRVTAQQYGAIKK